MRRVRSVFVLKTGVNLLLHHVVRAVYVFTACDDNEGAQESEKGERCRIVRSVSGSARRTAHLLKQQVTTAEVKTSKKSETVQTRETFANLLRAR